MAYHDSFFDSKEFKSNLQKYEDCINNKQSLYMEADDLTDIAEYYHSIGDTTSAVDAAKYAINLFPGATAPLSFLARMALIDNKNVEEAYSYVDQINDKSDLDYYYIKSEIMIAENRIEEADAFIESCFNEVREDDKEDFILDTATLYADYNMIDKAEKWLELCDDKETSDYKELQGRIALSKGEYEECENIFKQLLDEDPYSTPYWNHLASSQFLHNNIKDSITSSEFSIAINPSDDEAILNKANGLFQLGNYEEALEYYKRFSALCPNEESGYMLQGMALYNLDRIEEALSIFLDAEKKTDVNSQNIIDLYQEIAFAYSKLGKIDKAMEYLDKAEAISIDRYNEITVLRGHLYLENEKIGDAYKYFKKAVRESHSSPKIFLQIAISICECGFTKLSYKMLKTLFKSVSDNWTEGYSYLALCCYDLNKYDEFMEAVKTACEKDPFEAKKVLADLFPQDIEPCDYYDYLVKKYKTN